MQPTEVYSTCSELKFVSVKAVRHSSIPSLHFMACVELDVLFIIHLLAILRV